MILRRFKKALQFFRRLMRKNLDSPEIVRIFIG